MALATEIAVSRSRCLRIRKEYKIPCCLTPGFHLRILALETRRKSQSCKQIIYEPIKRKKHKNLYEICIKFVGNREILKLY